MASICRSLTLGGVVPTAAARRFSAARRPAANARSRACTASAAVASTGMPVCRRPVSWADAPAAQNADAPAAQSIAASNRRVEDADGMADPGYAAPMPYPKGGCAEQRKWGTWRGDRFAAAR